MTWKSTLLVAALAATACDDPAKGKPQAEVGSAQPNTTAAASDARVQYTLVADQSKVDFVGSKVTGKHDGGFKSVKGTASMDGETPSVEIDIDMTSVWSDDEKLTGHLKSGDFFDVQNHPSAKFVSTKIEKGGSDGATHTVTGNLTLRGATKSIKFPATISTSADGATVKAEFSINRKNFGIVYAGMPDDLIRDDVIIKLDTTFKKQKQS